MISKQLLVTSILFVAMPATAEATSDPCAAAAHRSPIARALGHLVITRDAASYVARHAELACAKLEELVHDPANAKTPLAPAARAIEGELETGVLAPIFRLFPDLRGRDLTAADAPGASVKMGAFRHAPPTPLEMGPATASHLRWIADDADRRAMAILRTSKTIEAAEAAQDMEAEIGFVAAPAYRSYPRLWEIESRELEKRAPKQPRTAQSDSSFRDAAPAPGSVTLTPAAIARMRAFATELKGHGCQILDLSWSLGTRWKGPDDTQWHERGPELGLGAFDCGQMPPDVVRTIAGMKITFRGDKAHSLTGKTIDFDGKHFVVKGG